MYKQKVANRLGKCLNVILSWWIFFSLYTGKVHYLVLLPHMPSQDCLNVNNVIVKKLKSICWAHTSVLVLNLNVTGVTELHVNGAVLNHIKSVNTSNTNVTIVTINHKKSIEKQRQKHRRTNQHSFSPAKATSHSQSWLEFWWRSPTQNDTLLLSITLYQRSYAPSGYSWTH